MYLSICPPNMSCFHDAWWPVLWNHHVILCNSCKLIQIRLFRGNFWPEKNPELVEKYMCRVYPHSLWDGFQLFQIFPDFSQRNRLLAPSSEGSWKRKHQFKGKVRFRGDKKRALSQKDHQKSWCNQQDCNILGIRWNNRVYNHPYDMGVSQNGDTR